MKDKTNFLNNLWRRAAKGFTQAVTGSRALLPQSAKAFVVATLLCAAFAGGCTGAKTHSTSSFLDPSVQNSAQSFSIDQAEGFDIVAAVKQEAMGRTLLENMKKAGKEIVLAKSMPRTSELCVAGGFYDPLAEKIVIKHSENDPALLVHEAVHAGQDVLSPTKFMRKGEVVKAIQAGLANEAGATAMEVLRRLNDIRNGDGAAFDSLRKLSSRHPSYELFEKLVAWTEKDPSILEKTGDAEKLPDQAVVDGLIARFYESDNLAAYISGYISKIDPKALEQALQDNKKGAKPGQFSSQDILRMILGEDLYKGERFPLAEKAVNESWKKILNILGVEQSPGLPQTQAPPSVSAKLES